MTTSKLQWQRLLALLGVIAVCTQWPLAREPPAARRPMHTEREHAYQATWQQLMDGHLATRQVERVIVCRWGADTGDGLCNRMMHAASCLLLAMLTNRTLLIDWPSSQFKWGDSDNEYTGSDPFDTIFQKTPFIIQSSSPRQRCQPVDLEDISTLAQLQKTDPALFYPDADCIQMSQARRFWGGLLTHNHHVSYGPASDAYSTIARRALAPLPSNLTWTKSTAQGCKWLIQYRARARDTWKNIPSFQAFTECGQMHGMHTAEGVWLLTDKDQPAVQELKSVPLAYCRHQPGCDRDSVHLMHYLGTCKRILLSDYSSFGQCVAGLSNIKRQWVVHTMETGTSTCTRKYDTAPSWRMTDFVPWQRADPRFADF